MYEVRNTINDVYLLLSYEIYFRTIFKIPIIDNNCFCNIRPTEMYKLLQNFMNINKIVKCFFEFLTTILEMIFLSKNSTEKSASHIELQKVKNAKK